MNKILHLVTDDAPVPADRSNLMDAFTMMRHLHLKGVNIHLHCLKGKHSHDPSLRDHCMSVAYYAADDISSMTNKINGDEHPVLIAGTACNSVFPLTNEGKRNIILRLTHTEPWLNGNFKMRSYSWWEKLFSRTNDSGSQKNNSVFSHVNTVLTTSQEQATALSKSTGHSSVKSLTPFIPWDSVESKEGLGTFCLFHGNFESKENEEMALWLLEKVFNNLEVPFVVAGNNASAKLEKAAHKKMHTCLVNNPGHAELQDLINKAQINILPSSYPSGPRYKVLNAVFCGRHILVNDESVHHSPVASACHVASSASAFQSVITQLYHMPFAEEEIKLRSKIMQEHFHNESTAKELMKILWGSA